MKQLSFITWLFITLSWQAAAQNEACNNEVNVFSASIEPSSLYPNQNDGIEAFVNQEGNYVLLGVKEESSDPNQQNLFFEIFNSQGSPQLAREITPIGDDFRFVDTGLKSIHITEIIENNVLAGYAVATTIEKVGTGAKRILIMRLDLTGCIVWGIERTMENSNEEEFARDIIQNEFGELLVLIETDINTIILAAVERDGDFVQNDKYQLENGDIEVTSIHEIRSMDYPNLQYVVAGSAEGAAFVLPLNENFSHVNGQMRLIDIDDNSNTRDVITALGSRSDNTLILVGNTITSPSVAVPFVIELTPTVNVLDNGFGTINSINRYNIQQAGSVQLATNLFVNDNSTTISGFSFANETEPSSFIFEIDAQNSVNWGFNYEGNLRNGQLFSVVDLGADGILAAGTQWDSPDSKKITLIKAQPLGPLCDCSSPLTLGRSTLNSSTSLIDVTRTRPDWFLGFPDLDCSFLNAPLGFCERITPQGPVVGLEIATQTVACDGSEVCFPIVVRGFTDVTDIQFSINWDPSIFSYQSGTVLSAQLQTGR